MSLLVIGFEVNKCQVEDGVCVRHDFTIARRLLLHQVDIASCSCIAASGARSTDEATHEARLCSCNCARFLSISDNAEVVHQLPRTYTVHVLHNHRITFALLVLEPLHQVLCFSAGRVEAVLGVLIDLAVPSAG